MVKWDKNFLKYVIISLLLIVCIPNLYEPILYHHHPDKITKEDIGLSLFLDQQINNNSIVISDPRSMVIISGLTNIDSPIPRLLLESEYDNYSINRIEYIKNKVFLSESNMETLKDIKELIINTPSNEEEQNGNIKINKDSTFFITINGRTLHWLQYGTRNNFIFNSYPEFHDYLSKYPANTDYFEYRAKLINVSLNSNITKISLYVKNIDDVDKTCLINFSKDINNTIMFSIPLVVPKNFEGWFTTPLLNYFWHYPQLFISLELPVGVLTRFDSGPPFDYYECSGSQYVNKTNVWLNSYSRHLWLIATFSNNIYHIESPAIESLTDLYDYGLRFLIPFKDKHFSIYYNKENEYYIISIHLSSEDLY